MESREGLEYQVVNKQGQVLIESRHLLEGTTNLIKLGVKSAERATAGEAGFILEQHARRPVEVLTGYAPIPEQKDFPKLEWGILVQVDHQTVLGPIRSLIQTVTFWGMAIFFPLWVLLLWTMHRLRAEWHQTEAAQQASQELVNQKRTLLATVEAFFIQLNDATVVAEWTNQAERTFGITADAAIGKPFGGLAIAWDWPIVSEAIAQVAQNRAVVRLNKVVLSKVGERSRYLKLTLSPLKTSSGLDIVLMGEDITEYLALEHDLSQAQKLESLGQLAAGVAHEINTPTQFVGDNLRFLSDAFTDLGTVLDRHHTLLTSAKAGLPQQEAIERCEDEARRVDLEYLQEEVPKAIAQSFEGVERITKIVRAMKEFAHPGGEEAAYEDLNKAIQTTVEVSRNEWKYVAEMTMDLTPDLPPVFCQLGPINQVVLNIIVNAAHAIGDMVKGTRQKGRITISTRPVGDGVEIRISDTGGGIPETIREKIFDPFFTTKPVGKGTGQGLAIARSVVVDKHGGRINVESQVDQGTTFTIHLPVKPKEASSLREAA
jgi:PAS domain S-box-containing protein